MAELEQWLTERDVPADQAADVVGHLVENGGLDDSEFARRFAEDKRQLSGWGSERIRRTLAQRGVAEGEIEAAVGGEDIEVETRRAVTAIEGRGFDLDDDRDRGRALGFLVRRGFAYEIAYEAIRQGLPR